MTWPRWLKTNQRRPIHGLKRPHWKPTCGPTRIDRKSILHFPNSSENFARTQPGRSPAAAALSARLVAASHEIDNEWDRLKKEQGLDPGKWGPGVQQIYAVVDAWPADAPKKLESLRGVIVDPGTGYASFVAIARKVVRNLDYMAVYGGSENEETLKLSATMQELCHRELRNRYFKEDQCGESTRGALPNPERPMEQPMQ